MVPLFSNAHFVAIDKPAGWLSVPSRRGANDPRACAGRELEAELGIRLWPVHRLDVEVTGVLLFAKSAAAHRQANAWFEQRLVAKTYQALTEGVAPANEEAIWQSQLLRGKRRAFASPHGKPAETLARFLATVPVAGSATLLWQLRPLSGRPHQLRFELARHGFAILGDGLYGSTRPCPGAQPAAVSTARAGDEDEEVVPSIALRCVQLAFAACPGADALGLPVSLEAQPLLEWLNLNKDHSS